MDASTTLTITRIFLDWTLLGFLLAWMVTFAVLALRANPTSTLKPDELPTPAYSFPVPAAATSLYVIATEPVAVSSGNGSHDTSGEMGMTPMA